VRQVQGDLRRTTLKISQPSNWYTVYRLAAECTGPVPRRGDRRIRLTGARVDATNWAHCGPQLSLHARGSQSQLSQVETVAFSGRQRGSRPCSPPGATGLLPNCGNFKVFLAPPFDPLGIFTTQLVPVHLTISVRGPAPLALDTALCRQHHGRAQSARRRSEGRRAAGSAHLPALRRDFARHGAAT
jgi:hypothetical protein